MSALADAAQVLGDLPGLLAGTRERLGLHLDQAGEQIGVSASTLCRVENGEWCSLKSALRILRWLDKQGTPGS